MISVNDVSKVSALLSEVFFYGFSHGYSNERIEEIIINNPYISQLENGDASFLINENSDKVVESFFKIIIEPKVFTKTNPLSLWLGEIYTRLFFAFNKSFSFIFLYLPITDAVELFPLFHEMDISQTTRYFDGLTSLNSIISLLLKKKKIRAYELSALTGINYNTIVSYTRNNDYIYNAKFEHLFSISQILKVNLNIFARKINNTTNSEMFAFDKNNQRYRSYLGLFIISLFNQEIDTKKYSFDKDKEVLVCGNNYIKTLTTSITINAKQVEEKNSEIIDLIEKCAEDIPFEKRKQYTIVVFEYNQISSNIKPYECLIKLGFYNIFIITFDNVFTIGQKISVSPLKNTITSALITRAKEAVGGDFAI